jgi:hypothetical protein
MTLYLARIRSFLHLQADPNPLANESDPPMKPTDIIHEPNTSAACGTALVTAGDSI